MDLESIENKWNSFAELYALAFEKMTVQSARTLYEVLDVPPEDIKILEVASGPGTCAYEMAQRYKHVHIAAVDYAKAMVDMTRAKLSKLEEVSDELFSKRLSVSKCDAQDLSPIESSSIDRYISNLCLMLVPDHTAMMKECFRVLKSGGVAAFSVWGDKTKDFVFKFFNEACLHCGVPQESPGRSNHHLGLDDAKLRNELLGYGFEKVVMWHQFVVFECFSAQKVVEVFCDGPSVQSALNEFSDGKAEEVRKEFVRIVEKHLSTGMPVGFDVVLFVCHK